MTTRPSAQDPGAGAYERLRRPVDESGHAANELRALREKVRQLQAENAWLRQQLDALRGERGGTSAHPG